MPDTWRCECGYTNLGSKTCLVCRRPRQAVPPARPEPVDDAAVGVDRPQRQEGQERQPPRQRSQRQQPKQGQQRPLKARSAKKAAPRKRAD